MFKRRILTITNFKLLIVLSMILLIINFNEKNDAQKHNLCNTEASWVYNSMDNQTKEGIFGKNQVEVAILDTGIKVDNNKLQQQLSDKIKKNKTDIYDENGHGTKVAKIITSHSPLNIKIIPIKVMNTNGTGSIGSLKKGLKFAINAKVDIINISLQLQTNDLEVKKLVEKAKKNNIAIVAATGNNGTEVLSYPARYEEVISVGSHTKKNAKSLFSQYGRGLDFVAPGESVCIGNSKSRNVSLSNGTSFASAYLTRAVAMYFSHFNPENRNISQLKKALKASTIDIESIGYDLRTGYGKINMYSLYLLLHLNNESFWFDLGSEEAKRHKSWRVNFNKPLDNREHNITIEVRTTEGEKVKTSFSYINNKTISIAPPQKGYQKDQEYLILVSINSLNNKNERNYKMSFKTTK